LLPAVGRNWSLEIEATGLPRFLPEGMAGTPGPQREHHQDPRSVPAGVPALPRGPLCSRQPFCQVWISAFVHTIVAAESSFLKAKIESIPFIIFKKVNKCRAMPLLFLWGEEKPTKTQHTKQIFNII